MKTAVEAPTKRAPRETLNLRIPAAERGLIDAPAQPNERLQRTMKVPLPWDKA
jgi:uncharacterized protein (DUF1778 family)